MGSRPLPAAWAAPIASILLGGAGLLTARLAVADALAREDTAASLRRAIELDRFGPPAAYLERLAQIDPDHSQQWLGRALAADPRSTAARIDRGLAEEQASRFGAAEADLREAAALDRRYLPAWTLANFYFRRGRSDEFWTWARRSASIAYDDLRPLLALGHSMDPDPRSVISRLGGGDRLTRADLDYLVQQGRLDQAQQVARLMLAGKPGAQKPVAQNIPRILALSDRQLRANRVADALELWNAVEPRIDPRRGPLLANANFSSAPSGVAFDWSLPSVTGATSSSAPARLRFSLSGDQPESCALLEQPLVLLPGQRYRLSFEYLTIGLNGLTGVAWAFGDRTFPSVAPSPAWSESRVEFAFNPPRMARAAAPWIVPLRLIYHREPGTVRAQGQFQLRHLRLEIL